MKILICMVYSFMITSLLFGQATVDKKRDYQWAIGYYYYQNGNLMDFNAKMKIYNYKKKIHIREYNGAICDKNGQLLFMTNGCNVYNKNFEIMKNGDKLNDGQYFDLICQGDNPGMRLNQAVMILPYKNDNTYIIFHKTLDDETVNFAVSPSIRLKYSVVDMSKDNNLGEIIEKDKPILQDTMVDGELLACRHANGKDWWILTPQWSLDGSNNNQYYSFLLKKDTILGPYEQRIGKAPTKEYSNQASFSPDGTKYARIRAKEGLYLFDFDRSTGLLSNPRPPILLNKSAFRCGVTFSPNSKYVYASCDSLLWQIDATSANPDATKEVVAEYDGFKVNDAFTSTFDGAMLAPDCKIYIAHASTIEYLTVINYPNLKGKASGIEQHGLKLPTKVAWGLPNYPHFRLGAVGETHTPCDSTINPYIDSNFKTTALDDAEAPAISVALYPNPAQEEVNIDLFGYVNRYRSGVWELYDIQGQRVVFYPVFENKSEYRYDISQLSNGMYFWRMVFDGKIGQSGKLVVLK